jgi:hypothetical protein
MRILILFFTFTFFCQLSYAQENSYFERRNEFGVNCTKILGNVLSLSDVDPSAPYSAFYAKHFNGYTIRISAGVNMESSSLTETPSPGVILTKTIQDNLYTGRLSLEKRSILGARTAVTYGIDFTSGLENNITKTENFFYRNQYNLSFGGGPALRFYYKLNKRLYLSTESGLMGNIGFNKETTILGLDPAIVNTSNPTKIFFQVPTTLYVGFNF